MKREPFRFLHAAGLRLDHQLHGTGPLPEKLREIVEEASHIAFERVIGACLERQVDFLLLAGDSFDCHDEGLRGQVALARGLERLAEHNISTCIVTGKMDLARAWLRGLRFSETVHFLRPGSRSSAAIRRQEQHIATVYGLFAPEGSVQSSAAWGLPDQPAGPFTIGLVCGRVGDSNAEGPAGLECPTLPRSELAGSGVDYWALGGAAAPETMRLHSGLAHDPGSPQGFRPQETGPRGCTLVEVNATGEMQATFIPTAPVRWEWVQLCVRPEMDQAALLLLMKTALRQREQFPSDEVWLVDWIVAGEGPLLGRFAEQAFRDQLFDQLHQDSGLSGVAVHTRGVHLASDHTFATNIPANRFAAEYDDALAVRLASSDRMLDETLVRSSLHGGPWEDRLNELLMELDPQEIGRASQTFGQNWFARKEEAA